jgi:hypothetical protein
VRVRFRTFDLAAGLGEVADGPSIVETRVASSLPADGGYYMSLPSLTQLARRQRESAEARAKEEINPGAGVSPSSRLSEELLSFRRVIRWEISVTVVGIRNPDM